MIAHWEPDMIRTRVSIRSRVVLRALAWKGMISRDEFYDHLVYQV